MKTLVSVIIPVFNCEKYLGEAIESVFSQKGFRLDGLDVIVVDDGSTDETAKIAKGFGHSIRYIYQKNAGSCAARNKGIQAARGDFFAFLDADDLWIENKLAVQMKAFIENPEVEAVFGHVKQFLSSDIDEEAKKRLFCPVKPMPGFLPPMMLIKRESFFRVGLFEEKWRVGQEVGWILRAREVGIKTIMLPDLIYMRRLHKNNKGVINRKFINDRVKIIKAHLDSRRRNNTIT
ncbi:MAG: glycosyltransferase family 2 protein [Syntrophaceae bacterium]|nr:glycosyltransferase family 2 protein [Syntrophaceae bacterium]